MRSAYRTEYAVSKFRLHYHGIPWDSFGHGNIESAVLGMKNPLHRGWGIGLLLSGRGLSRSSTDVNTGHARKSCNLAAYQGVKCGSYRSMPNFRIIPVVIHYSSVPEACRIIGISRSELYRKLAAGVLRAKKCGTKTLVDIPHALEWIRSLPDAEISTK